MYPPINNLEPKIASLMCFLSLFIFGAWNQIGWTRLPVPPLHSSIANMRHLCAGMPLSWFEPQFCCHFCDTSFTLDGRPFHPCFTRYHPVCLCIGLPFQSRLQGSKGLRCPPRTEVWRQFVCEACTVRAVLFRELSRNAEDIVLLMLERVRIVDTTNHWAYDTLKTYNSKFNVIREFEKTFLVSVLPHTPLSHPPCGPSIRLMWAQERYSLYPARWHHHSTEKDSLVKFATVRGLRSAASHHWTWDLLHVLPAQLTLGFWDKPTVVAGCSPTDELVYTIFTDGMKHRLGDNVKPSVALLDQHVSWMDAHFKTLHLSAVHDPVLRRNTCRAAVTNLIAWLGWLRAGENFGLTWGVVSMTPPPSRT
jgi:hypothetical protein